MCMYVYIHIQTYMDMYVIDNIYIHMYRYV